MTWRRVVLSLFALLLVSPLWADEGSEHDYAVDDAGGLYEIRCAAATVERVGRVEVAGRVPRLWDLAATPDGYLYGIADDGLFLINVTDPSQSRRIGPHGIPGAYGMTAVGPVLLVNTKDNRVFLVDRRTAQATELGAMGGGFAASGDIALVGEKIFSAVKDSEGRETLVELDPETGAATEVAPLVDEHRRAVPNMYGLICREGALYGLTLSGDLMRVDENTGRCVTLESTGVPWYGASGFVRF